MSQPDHEAITNQIRASRLEASPELRARVRAIAATASPAAAARPRRELPWRRLTLVAVPAAVAAAMAVSLGVGLTTTGSSSRDAAPPVAPNPTLPLTGPVEDQAGTDTLPPKEARGGVTSSSGAAGVAGSNLPATPGRAQLYEAELTLKITNLSAATKRALRLTRDFNGYVRSVEYGSGTESGSAYIVVRVPVGSVQEALVKYSAIGSIIDQHVSIQDVQPTVDKRFRQMQGQRDQIAKLQAQLQSPTLSSTDRTALENLLVGARRQLILLQKEQTALARQTSFATVSLDLRNGKKAVVVPTEPGRIGKALHRSGQILADEAKVLIYVLIVGAPFFVLGAFLFGGVRLRRRQNEERLLSTS